MPARPATTRKVRNKRAGGDQGQESDDIEVFDVVPGAPSSKVVPEDHFEDAQVSATTCSARS